MVTEMLIDWSTTWLFVNTSPDDVMIIPVPEAAPVEVAVWTTVLMSTRAGSTLAAMFCALIVPLWLGDGLTAEMGAVELAGSECCGALATGVWLEECRYRAIVRPMPTPKAPAKMVAAILPAASQRPQARPGVGNVPSSGCGTPANSGLEEDARGSSLASSLNV